MTDEKKSAGEKPPGMPVPSGAMYIGLCTTRAQSANLRWQYAIVFMALNAAVGNWCVQLFNSGSAKTLMLIVGIAVIMSLANLLFRGLVDRANQWIDYFTIAVESIELKHGTETGVLVFSDPKYLAKEAAESLVKGFRFRKGIQDLSNATLVIWIVVSLVFLIWASILIGQGKL